jgi:hypothetical protein
MDRPLLQELHDAGFLDVVRDAGPVEGTVVVEQLAAALAGAPVSARILAGPLAGITDLPLAVGVMNGRIQQMVAYGTECEAFLVLEGERAWLASIDDVDVEPVASAFGAGYGLVSLRRGSALDEGAAHRIRRGWQVAIAVEAGAMMIPAIEQTAAHVTQRHQFGRPIGSFQAVQHRLARTYVMAQGTMWLARRAAWFHDDEFLTASAAAFACEAAEATYTNTHQVSGAIGVTSEFGLHFWTMRLLALARIAGGKRAHARRVAAARRSMDLSGLPMPIHPSQVHHEHAGSGLR